MDRLSHYSGPCIPQITHIIQHLTYIPSPARRYVFDAPEVPSLALSQLSFCCSNFKSVSDCFRPTSMLFDRGVPDAQRRGRRKVQAPAQDLLILVERIVIPAPGPAAYLRLAQPGKRRRVYFGGLPRLANTSPRESAAHRSRLANLSASFRSGPGGISRASSKASTARVPQSYRPVERCVSLSIAPQSSC
jgi:hypothetical protein